MPYISSYPFLPYLPQWHKYASMNWVSIGSDKGLSLIRCQAITWTNAHLLSIGPLRTNFSEIWKLFIQENAFENIVCEM